MNRRERIGIGVCLGEKKLWQLVGYFLKLETIIRIDHLVKVDARPRRGKTNSFPPLFWF